MFRLTSVALAIVAFAVLVGAQSQDRPDLQLKAAVYKETVEGDLQGAIAVYQQIVSNAAAPRPIAAAALLGLGGCYDKLGEAQTAEARKAYERLLTEYADQVEAASRARARLGRIRAAGAETGIVTRQVWTGPKVDFSPAVISADGHSIVYTDWSANQLALHDLTTGTNRVLVKNEYPAKLAISPLGGQVAYPWEDKGRLELRVLGIDAAAASPRVLAVGDDVTTMTPDAWSPDGRWIAVQLGRRDGTHQIAVVNAGDGAMRPLKSMGRLRSTRLSFSPDGTYLAFDLLPGDKTDARDVFVLAVDGSREIPAVVHAAHDMVIGWMPDARHLLFASDRGGSQALWALPWADGKSTGEPQLLKTDIDLSAPLGVTRAGGLYYGVSLSRRDVYLAEIDVATGAALSPPIRPIQQALGANSSPDWSPDGKALAYVSGRAVLAIRSMDSGQTRELRPALDRVFSPRWAPDGRSLAVIGDDRKGQRGIYRIDAQTGATRAIVQVPPGGSLYGMDWWPDGKRILYRERQPEGFTVFEHDVDSGTRREFMRPGPSTMSLSPDGSQLAYVARSPSWKLMVMPMAGGQPREVLVEGVQGSMVVAWTPDSRSILLQSTTGTGGDLWLVSADGGRARKVVLNLRNLIPFARFNPRTNQIAVTVDTSRNEVWVMEHLLPAGPKPSGK